MIVIGIDPSLTGTGLCRLTDGKLLDKERDISLIKTKPEGKQIKERIHRCREIVSQIEIFCGLSKDIPVLLVIEGYAFRAQGRVFDIGESGGLIRDCMLKTQEQFGTDIMEVGPGQLKKFITGKGNCEKDLILKEIYKRYKMDFNNNNIADAAGLALIGYSLYCIHNNINIKLAPFQKEVLKTLEKG